MRAETIPLGDWIRYFGDGYESTEPARQPGAPARNTEHRWRIPVMDGEFVVDSVAGVEKGIGGGNLVLHAKSQAAGLAAALRAAGALAELPNIITPFPGGVCRSGSKVGSQYKNLIASTADTYCPTLRDEVATELVDGATCVYEIVINGVDLEVVRAAMRVAIEAAAGEGLLAIGARSFGGKLGKHRIGLRDLFAGSGE